MEWEGIEEWVTETLSNQVTDNLSTKIKTVMDYNPLNNVRIYESILINKRGKFFPVECRLSNIEGILELANNQLETIIIQTIIIDGC